MPHDDVLMNKAAIIERCIRRIAEEYRADPGLASPTHVDALTLNIERACQACIDMAMFVTAQQHLGSPQSSAEAFTLMERAGLLERSLAHSLRGMTGFRNIAVHEYQAMDHSVLTWIVAEGWRDWVRFCQAVGLRVDVSESL